MVSLKVMNIKADLGRLHGIATQDLKSRVLKTKLKTLIVLSQGIELNSQRGVLENDVYMTIHALVMPEKWAAGDR